MILPSNSDALVLPEPLALLCLAIGFPWSYLAIGVSAPMDPLAASGFPDSRGGYSSSKDIA